MSIRDYFLPRVRFLGTLLLVCSFNASDQRLLAQRAEDRTAIQGLESELRRMSLKDLVELARREGDAARGAIVFFQPTMACAKCHSTASDQSHRLGPLLAANDPRLTDETIVEAILDPSKSIRPGYESASVLTTSGKNVIGLLVNRSPDHVAIRDTHGLTTKISTDEIDEVVVHDQSFMPTGQVNQLTSRQQFLDLVRYLYEIRDGGPERARQLQPSESFLTLKVPEYESQLDHAGLVSDWGSESLARGEAIYHRVCANCHGTKERVGSLPTSLRFADGKFKNGSDPFSMYRTLTFGFGFMPAQTWMVPSQKYDVIHYIRETFLKPYNRSQWTEVDAVYLASLPKGNTRGPEPTTIEPWSAMDYGNYLTHTFELPGPVLNIAYKGVAVRLDPGAGGVSRGEQWTLFDTDTMRVAGGWHQTGGVHHDRFVDWRGIQFNGEHGIHPKAVGVVDFTIANGPGWAEPKTEKWFDDDRIQGRDGRRYGPLPAKWAKYRGLYVHGAKVIFAYTVGSAAIYDSPGRVALSNDDSVPVFSRTFNIGPREHDLLLQVAETGETPQITNDDSTSSSWVSSEKLSAGVTPARFQPQWSRHGDRLVLRIPAGPEALQFTLWVTAGPQSEADVAEVVAAIPEVNLDLQQLTHGGQSRWNQRLETHIQTSPGTASDPFAVDVLTAPESNPGLAQTRFTGLDFFKDGSIAVCTWDGDVWHVRIDEVQHRLEWHRIASGLFQPLGLKVIDDRVHVGCRDQLAVLHDLNGDGETDFYECLNNDHQVTEHFHEFAMGLQTDSDGNFYYAKSARHALPAIVPHHGTLLRISRDGTETRILANGFRAANGVCLNADGTFLVTDQEGHWNPKNRINWVSRNPSGRPKFYGNMFGYHEVTDTSNDAMEPPLCWITNKFDRSPGELLWIDSAKWGALRGGLLNLSYGTGKVFLVLHEQVDGVHQGGMIQLPIRAFPTGVMRGRFHPHDQQLYACGMFAWAGDATQPGGLYRIRATGQPIQIATALHATSTGLELVFSEPLAVESVTPDRVQVRTWSLKRTANYGSNHFDEKRLPVAATTVSDAGKKVKLIVPALEPTWCMEIGFDFRSVDGKPITGVINNTIHRLR